MPFQCNKIKSYFFFVWLLVNCFQSLHEAIFKKIVCLQLPTQVFSEWVGRSGIIINFFFLVG